MRPCLPVLLATLTAGLATGCSNTVSVIAGHPLRVGLSEYRVTPQDIDAHAGGLEITVHNDGRLTHDLVISTMDGAVEAQTKPIAPGQSFLLEASLTPGQYELSSSVLNDQALGAYGTLNVSG